MKSVRDCIETYELGNCHVRPDSPPQRSPGHAIGAYELGRHVGPSERGGISLLWSLSKQLIEVAPPERLSA